MKVRYFTPLLGFVAIAFIAWLLAMVGGVTTGLNALTASFGVTVLGGVLAYTVGVRLVAQCPECHNYMARSAAVPRRRPAPDCSAVAAPHRSATTFSYFVPLLAFVASAVVIGVAVAIHDSRVAGFNAFTIGYGATLVAACVAYPLGLWAVLTDNGARDLA